MAVRKIKGSWWVDFRFNDTRHRKRSPENSKAGAEIYELTLRQRLARGDPLEGDQREALEPTFAEFAEQWFDDYVRANNKFSEQRAKKSILGLSLIPFFGKMLVSEISGHDIEQYKAQQVRAGSSNSTVRNRLTVLNKCLTCAYDWLEIKTPQPKIKWPKPSPLRTEHLSPDECEALLSVANGVLYELVLTALRTGMRLGELKGLQWSSIDWQNRSVSVRHSRCDLRKMLDTPKNNRERHVPLDLDLYDLLYRRKRSTGYVFTNSRNKPFKSSHLSLRLNRLCKEAGLRAISWHVLRHTFASHLAMRGTPLNVVQALLGHASITTTMRYAHVAPSTLRTAIDMLNPKRMLEADFGQPVVNPWIEEQRRQIPLE